MEAEDRKVEVLQKLKQHDSRLDQILNDVDQGADEAHERFIRWKERVVEYLSLNVSEREAERFAGTKIRMTYSDVNMHLKYEEIPAYKQALRVLVEEVEDNPYLLLPRTSPTTSADLTNSESKVETQNTNVRGAVEEMGDEPVTGSAQNARNVFVVHGRNIDARNSLFRFLRSIGLRPIEWSQAIQLTGKASPFIGEILDVAFSQAQAVVVLMTPDDVAQLQEQFRSPHDPPYEANLTGQARPNVLFEAGMAMGRNPDRTVIVELGTLRPFSDIAGRHTVKLSNDSTTRQELAQRLETAGCEVDLSGRDWHTEGDFNPPNTQSPRISDVHPVEREQGAKVISSSGTRHSKVTKSEAVANEAVFTLLGCPVYGVNLKTGDISFSGREDNKVALVEFYRETDDTALSWIEVRAHVEFYDLNGKRIARLNDGFWHKEHAALTQLAKFSMGDSMFLVVAFSAHEASGVFDGHLAEHRVALRYISEFIPEFDKPLPDESVVRVRLLSVRSGKTVLDARYDFRLKSNPFSLTPVIWGAGESSETR